MKTPIEFPSTSDASAAPLPYFLAPNGHVVGGACGFTQRQQAALLLRVPCSGLPWLDAMIREARRADAAQACVAAEAGAATTASLCQDRDLPSPKNLASWACEQARRHIEALWPEQPVDTPPAGLEQLFDTNGHQ